MKVKLDIDGTEFLAETDYGPSSTLSTNSAENVRSAIFAVLIRELKTVAIEYLKTLGAAHPEMLEENEQHA